MSKRKESKYMKGNNMAVWDMSHKPRGCGQVVCPASPGSSEQDEANMYISTDFWRKLDPKFAGR